MIQPQALIETLLILCLGLLLYIYAGFPALLWLFTRGKSRETPPDLPDSELPTVSFVVAAYNEETVIQEKLENCLRIDYPADRLQFIFVSDGSTDNTNEILLRYKGQQIEISILPERNGKVFALHRAFQLCRGEILVLSDANTYYRPDALRKLVRHFAESPVGLVTGDVRLLPSRCTFGEGEGLYYRYERSLQILESAFGSTVAIDGAMYALRRCLLRPASHGLVNDDLITAMNVGVQGYRMIYDPEAIAEEDPTPADHQEFQRKVRIVALAIRSLLNREAIPTWRQGKLLWTYFSHKVLRWFAPLFLIGAFLLSLVAAEFSSFWEFVFVLQIVFYLLALAAWQFPSLNGKLFRTPYYFSMVNAAALFGILRALRSEQKAAWARTERVRPNTEP